MLELVPPTVRVRAFDDLDAFELAVAGIVSRHRAITVDCSGVRSLSIAAVRVLERASHHGTVTRSNASPMVRLYATVFGLSAPSRDLTP
jgi:hypothetical protein